MISNCGKNFAISSGVGALAGGDETIFVPCGPAGSVTSVCVAMFMAIRQRGHNPVGELGGNGVPHCGQTGVVPVLIPDTYRSPPVCYMKKRFSSPERGCVPRSGINRSNIRLG